MEIFKSIYRAKPEYVKDTLHLHFFKTALHYEKRMNDFPRLEISSQLKLALFLVNYATSYSIENGNYNFEIKLNFLKMPDRIPFPLLFNELIRTCFSGNDIEDMYDRIYKSENAMLIKLAEQFKDKDITISSELFEFIKRKECNTYHNWKINELLTGNWNYTLLALNKGVWENAFDKDYLNNLFQKEKEELDKIDEGKLYGNGYPNYIIRVDSLIQEKFS